MFFQPLMAEWKSAVTKLGNVNNHYCCLLLHEPGLCTISLSPTPPTSGTANQCIIAQLNCPPCLLPVQLYNILCHGMCSLPIWLSAFIFVGFNSLSLQLLICISSILGLFGVR